MTERFPKIKEYADEIAKRIAAGESKYEWYSVLCVACKDIRNDEEFCKMHRISAHLSGCDVCSKD